MTNESNDRTAPSDRRGANVWLVAVACLAVGFAVGREVGMRRGGGGVSPPAEETAKAGAAPTRAPGVAYKSESQFPASWVKAAELTSARGISFDGLSDAQKAISMQALNERRCECGCGMESLAVCAKRDASCPRSPKLVKQVVAMIKQGKSLADLYAYLDVENKGSGAPAQPQAPAGGGKKVTLPPHSPRKGPKAAKVTIAEFSDFQCPFCSRAIPTLKQIEDKYKNDVAVVFINQPLAFHQNAMIAAQAFLAANRQGKAWEMHDKMFANQQALAQADLEKYAQELGLNLGKFKKDLDDPKLKEQIQGDQALASQVGATGTPTFFINGRELVGAQPFSAFQTIIDEEIKQADALIKQGTKLQDVYAKRLEDLAAAAPPAAPSAPGAPPAPPAKVDIAVGNAPAKGLKNAPITIVEFSDFQCPFCSRVNPTIKQIEDAYKGKVRIAFKHLPLPFHQNAQIAAEASMAAHAQGKFWEMHDKLFANQQQLDRASLEKYAQELGLNMTQFKAALDSGKYKDDVASDAKLASSVGATGTPAFFVNGRLVSGAQPFDNFKRVIDEELAKTGK